MSRRNDKTIVIERKEEKIEICLSRWDSSFHSEWQDTVISNGTKRREKSVYQGEILHFIQNDIKVLSFRTERREERNLFIKMRFFISFRMTFRNCHFERNEEKREICLSRWDSSFHSEWHLGKSFRTERREKRNLFVKDEISSILRNDKYKVSFRT